MLLRSMRILFSDEGGAGSGGNDGGGGAGAGGGAQGGDNSKTYSEKEFNELKTQRDNLKSEMGTLKQRLQTIEEKDKEAKDLLPGKEAEITRLKSELDTVNSKLTDTENKYSELDKTVRKNYLEQLSDEHKKVAKHITSIEGLVEYVKLNAVPPPAGQDAGKAGGAGVKDHSNSKWDDLTFSEKEELKEKQPEVWKRLYREKYGFNP